MLNLLPKGMILNHIVDTLKKDPENGIIKLLETAKSHSKSTAEKVLLNKISHYYATSETAKMQVRNLVYNTNKKTLYTFAEKIFDTLSQTPSTLTFLRMTTMAEATHLKIDKPIFPIIDLKNLNETTLTTLNKLKSEGHIFFVSIAVTEDNFSAATAKEVVLMLIKNGVRAIFYRITQPSSELEESLTHKVHQIRNKQPILAFLMKKDAPTGTPLNYLISETIEDKTHTIKLSLR